MSKAPKLKPCPFCGGRPIPVSYADILFSVACINPACSVIPLMTARGLNEHAAAKKWNQRAPSKRGKGTR
jgi:hypothetical protein